MTMNFTPENFRDAVQALPATPAPNTSEKYSFIDTKVVLDNMLDLGYQLFDFRRPSFRTKQGGFGLHELDFRRPEDMKASTYEVPRILFYNTYDGSRRAQFTSGIFRFICSNGLVIGDTIYDQRFLHMNLTEAEFLDQLGAAVQASEAGFTKMDRFKSITLDPSQYREMAKDALAIRYPEKESKIAVDPKVALMPRRREDVKTDLWTTWNVLQENLMRGGLPGKTAAGVDSLTRPVNQISKSTQLNRGLWTILETYGEAA